MKPRGFTLIELMVASVLCAILMGGVLVVLAGTARDRKRLDAANAASDTRLISDLLKRDLAAADTFASAADGRSLVLVGHGGLDRRTLTVTHRLVRVTYQVMGRESTCRLMRRQESLDDAAHPEDWHALVAAGISSVGVTTPGLPPGATPRRAVVAISRGAQVERRELVLK